MSQHHINDNINSFNNIQVNNSVVNNVSNNYAATDEKSPILAWISPLEHQIRHEDIRTRRVDKVGDWLLETGEYRDWIGGIGGGGSGGSGGAALFCYGSPGIGKTYISSLVIDRLCKQPVEGNAVVACFYFDFASQEEQSPAAILGSVLKQVVGGLDEIPQRIVEAYRNRGKAIGGQRLELAEIVEFLQDVSSPRHAFICIDALDECPEGHRVKLLDSLNQILQMSPGARVFLTGRPQIRAEVGKHLAGRVATRSISPTVGDITTFLRSKLNEDTMPDEMDESLEEEIIQNIPEMVSEIFLLVSLTIETILRETSIYQRRQKLRAMKDGLDLGGAYEATLERIRAQDGEKARLGMAVLMCISHSRRPLHVDEICHAIAIQIGSNDLNKDNISAISTLLSCCHGLVTMDQGASTVRLIHFTLQEHLCAHPDLFDRAHSTISETCLTYLNFQHVKDISAYSHPNPESTPFLEYASLYWGTHMRMELSDRAKTFALKLLDQFDSHISAKALWDSISPESPPGYTPDGKPFSALHCISYFGIAEVANSLIKMGRWDVNQRDSAGVTPLIWAARYGHEEVVKLLLLEKSIRPDQQDANDGRTALSWAAGNGHEGVVGLFLDPRVVNPRSIARLSGKVRQAAGLPYGWRHLNPDSSSKSGRTPLSFAAQNGHEGIVKQLLEQKYVNPDAPDSQNGHTALSFAAENGHEGIVRLLLGQKDVSPDIPESLNGLTPLLLAARNGHEGIVKLLLEREDVNPASLSHFGRTTLSYAAGNGHEGIVKLLLGRKEVNPDIPDNWDGQTPLSLAAEKGHEEIVKLLLEREDVGPDIPDSRNGRTPLSLAAGNGHEGIVKLLLERKDVGLDIPDKWDGQTPLSWAAREGREGVVRLLLGLVDVNPNRSTKSGRTPLSFAAENGRERVVKLFLGREDVNPDTPETQNGRTPLSWAAAKGHEGIVKLLLGREDVNPNSSGESGQTPLTLAAKNGHDRVVELLQAQHSDASGN